MPEATAGSENLWSDTSRWLERALGLHFTPPQWPDLQRGLEAAAGRLGLGGAAACARRAVRGAMSPRDLQVLAECLTVGETYFFRDPTVFEQIGAQVLQPLIAARRDTSRHLRLWSAGCSTGEEPYSLAMLIAGLLPDWREWNISILATDINPVALRKAQDGAYGHWSVRGEIPPQAGELLQQGTDGKYQVGPQLRRLVRFVQLNLVQDGYPDAATMTTGMDLVLCRNVLIYFSADRAQAVAEQLGRCLVEGGWLVTGSVERPRCGIPGLVPVGSGLFTAFRRRGVVAELASVEGEAARHPAKSKSSFEDDPAVVERSSEPPPWVATERANARPAASLPEEDLAGSARRLADAGQLEQAEHLCRLAVRADKLNPDRTYLLASILLERGAVHEASVALQRTLYLSPGHLLARFSLASLALRQGQVAAGQRLLSHALERLATYPADEVLAGSGGVTAGDLGVAIRSIEAKWR